MSEEQSGVVVQGEWLSWVPAQAEKPDSDITVLLFVPGCESEVWPGYWDGERWQWAEGIPVEGGEVVCWADMPMGLKT